MEIPPLNTLYKKQKTDRDIFQELMPFKVKEILLVATLYDAFSITSEGQFFDRIVGEYLQLNLYAAPRITSVSSDEEALLKLQYSNYDMIILTAGLNRLSPISLAAKIKKVTPEVPILLLVNNNSDLKYFKIQGGKSRNFERIFVWNGDSKIFLAMSKYVEDKINASADTVIGNVRIILLVEDSVRYYSRYLPLLYSIVMKQTQEIIHEHTVDELHKILKMRARPKILLATSYEEAIQVVNKYTENLLCVISDVSFNKNGIPSQYSGVDLLNYVRDKVEIPLLMQSSNLKNRAKADKLGVEFIHKESESLAHDIQHFLMSRCGFGDFVFKDIDGNPIDKATNLKEFQKKLSQIPNESLLYHGSRNGFSTWLMARGEINLARKLRPVDITDFTSVDELREAVINAFENVRLTRLRGRIVRFDPSHINTRRYVLRLGNGSFGGKGRGIAFLSDFIENISFEKLIPGIHISVPSTAIIGVEEFEFFIEKNNLSDTVYGETDIDYESVKTSFLQSELSPDLKEILFEYVLNSTKPLAIRSSGLFEDSFMQPFSGVYNTFLLPNDHKDVTVRFNQLQSAVKLVYASIFSDSSRNYFNAVNYKIEEEKMAVIIQEVIGNKHEEYFYSDMSGVAQSYNYYPFAYMEPDDGFSVAAVGLGMYVVGGEKSHRFCPKYPKLELKALSDQIKDSQTYFYAVRLNNGKPETLKVESENQFIEKLTISTAEKDGILANCAEVYDYQNERLEHDFDKKGPRVVNFANILLYDKFPLASAIEILLQLCSEAMGSPVELEYVVDFGTEPDRKPTLFLVQIKPLIQKELDVDINEEVFDESNALLIASKGMGNGIFSDVCDVILMKTEKFDRTKTEEMAADVKVLNRQLANEEREYVLIGPGRWGTRDKYTGIPVLWSHISKARVIIEVGLKDFPLDASLGSHFFHNVTSMNVGYFSVPYNSHENYMNTEMLDKGEVISETNYFRHIRFNKPLQIILDGKKRKAVIVVKE
ncbi:DUF5752 family protein [Saccharicrinis sp. FJH54]|uniref:DUF5752 family protein n=1 Tax=Saccharicrinis sp. FJH54 TaxID=3344665 RepID=UPI0035D4089D